MGLTNAFRDLMTALVIGGSGTTFANANAYIGVGDSTTAFAATQTDLQAATNKLRKAMDASFPTNPPSPANRITARSTFGTTDANFHWQEIGLFNAASAGTMLNRLVTDLGTKTSAATWQVTLTVDFSV
jgi:hypothetical protein